MHTLLAGLLMVAISPVAPDTPNRGPQFAVRGDTVALVFGSGTSVMFAKSTDGGATFSAPVKVAEVPVLPLSRHRGPRVAFAGTTILVSAIGGAEVDKGPHSHGLPADGSLMLWRSTDGGGTWSKPATLNDVPASAREGLHALAADEQGHVTAVWLDLRAKGTRLYGAISKDSGATWSPNIEVFQSADGTICQCCHPSLLALGRGEFAVMFRNVQGGSRDMYVLRLRDGKISATATKAGQGTWPINACPMDGGGMTTTTGGAIQTAWRRDKEVFLAQEGKPEARLGEGKDVALSTSGDGSPIAVWVEHGGITAWTRGKTQTLAAEGAFPAVITVPGGDAIAAWEDRGSIAIRRLK